MTDVVHRVTAQTVLRFPEPRRSTLPEVVIGPDWRYRAVSREAADVLETTPDALIGRVLHEVYPSVTGTPLDTAMRQAMTARVALRCRIPSPIYTDRDADCEMTPLADGSLRVGFRLIPRVSRQTSTG